MATGIVLGHRLRCQSGDGPGGLRRLSEPDPIEGAEQITRAWVELANRAAGPTTFLERSVNGQPGLVIEHNGSTVTVLAFDLADDRIKRIRVIRNPEKLRPWTANLAGMYHLAPLESQPADPT
ncbi:hypothetical protein [Amycolatopsis sp. FDAARGOS 1241]|uniref:hypothetical protein n=1 Tax=Amycolatopsis sp. FDAARGOS 1241 TaxID=2778070 RepID=UPI001950F41D|nr:hypothetical protein [Amycolatopsis sp. FDAARGOS 1241]QRP48986.1 hypothetical protein I6J71_14975 [Amycolatopsis sp. FDAARGOS 1241]